ncbi:hypothetical protein [Methylobacterium sp. A54F]
MSDVNKMVAAILAASKVSAMGPNRLAEDYLAEYDAIRQALDARDKAAANQHAQGWAEAARRAVEES